MEIKHLAFNPSMPTTNPHTILMQLLGVWEAEGWELDRIVPHHQYESIAVLHRTTSELSKIDEPI